MSYLFHQVNREKTAQTTLLLKEMRWWGGSMDNLGEKKIQTPNLVGCLHPLLLNVVCIKRLACYHQRI